MREFLREAGLIPVVVIEDAEQALPTAEALRSAGISLIEVTFRSSAAEESIRRISAEVPDLLIGAGTVLNLATAKKALTAGARFVVSPGFNEAVVEYCLAQQVPVFPGVSNPSQVEQALSYGLKELKFFPSESLGGVSTIKALAAVYPEVVFIPTGGINPTNLVSYMLLDAVLACGGSWFVNSKLIASADFEQIGKLSREALRLCCGFSLGHVGINQSNELEAKLVASQLGELFGFELKDQGLGIFVDRYFEIMKGNGFGVHGHLALAVNRIQVARRLLRNNGVKFRTDGEIFRDGRLIVAYLKQELAGFALHLYQR